MSLHSVLTIEDDPAIRRGVVDALTHFGYHVSQSGDGIEGARTFPARFLVHHYAMLAQ